jgi:hypothetical protein
MHVHRHNERLKPTGCRSREQRRRGIALSTSVSIVLSTMVGVVVVPSQPAGAATAAPADIVLQGSLPAFASQSGTVTVFGLPSLAGIQKGDEFQMPELASTAVSGTSFSLSVPTTELNNLSVDKSPVNVLVRLTSGTLATVEATSISLSSSPPLASSPSAAASLPTNTVAPGAPAAVTTTTSAPATQIQTLPSAVTTTTPTSSPQFAPVDLLKREKHSVVLAPFPSAHLLKAPLSPAAQTGSHLRPNTIIYVDGCEGVLLSDTEDSTRIGELHVAGPPDNVEGTYSYTTSADSDLSVGFSSSSDTGPWSSGGTYDMTNSIGSGGFRDAHKLVPLH